MTLEDLSARLLTKIGNYLSYRIRTKKEINDKLIQYLAKFDYSIAEKETIKAKIILDLEELKLIDDDAFAQTYVRQKNESKKPLSNRVLRLKLTKLGISTELLDKYVPKNSSEGEYEKALKVFERKLRNVHLGDDRAAKQRLYRFLAQRGFSSTVIKSVFDTFFKLK